MVRSAIAASLLALLPLSAAAQEALPRRAVLGASASPAPEGGALISAVRADSPASRGGLAAGDRVVRVGAQDVATPADFVNAVRASRANRAQRFEIVRGGAAQSLSITLDEAAREAVPAGVRVSYEAVRVGDSLRRVLISEPANRRGRAPAMLLMGGIGCYSIDDAANANDAYRALAHDLSQRGIVVMRLEKSGMGDSQGPACATTDFEQELASYNAAMAALRSDRRVDASQVYVFGHSIGTVGAPVVAQRNGAAGVIAAQGLGRTWIEYELINTRRQIELGSGPVADIDAAMVAKANCLGRAYVERIPVAELFQRQPECQGLLPLPASQAYMTQLTERNIGGDWAALSSPVLFIYGDADFVTDEADHRRLEAIVNGAHPRNASVAIIPGMDHFLVNRGTQAASFQAVAAGQAAGEYDPRFSAVIGDWICTRARCVGPVSAAR